MKILIIDDEEELCEAIKDFFSYKGYEVFTSITGLDGLKTIENEKPDVVFLDIRLPDILGVQMLEKIKKFSPNTKVVLMTGGVENEFECLDKSVIFKYITKPFTIGYLEKELMPELEKAVRGIYL